MTKRERDFIKRSSDRYYDLYWEHRDDDSVFALDCLTRAVCLAELLAALNRDPSSLWIGDKYENS